MTAKELIKVLEVLPEDQYICFGLGDLQTAKDKITDTIELEDDNAVLVLDGYERLNIGHGEDELFILNLHID